MIGTMPMTAYGRERAPAACHVDGSTRPQVIERGEAPTVSGVLRELECGGFAPVLLNTSFNQRGEPIVNDIHDVVTAFRAMELDFLVMGGRLFPKENPLRNL